MSAIPALNLPPVPSQLKPLTHFMKTASEHETRDPVVTYWCRFFAVQKGLVIDKSSTEAKEYLIPLLDWLEKRKKQLHSNEAITNEIVGQAHIENYTLKLFNWAYKMDLESNFNKNVVKAFYTAGILFDVMENFGELIEQFQSGRKYAKWKAAYIHNCLKNGETPVPGPMPSENDEDESISHQGYLQKRSSFVSDGGESKEENTEQSYGFSLPKPPVDNQIPFPPSFNISNPSVPPATEPTPEPSPSTHYNQAYTHQNVSDYSSHSPEQPGKVSVALMMKAQKFCKVANSALDYDDVNTAISHLEKALQLLETGKDVE